MNETFTDTDVIGARCVVAALIDLLAITHFDEKPAIMALLSLSVIIATSLCIPKSAIIELLDILYESHDRNIITKKILDYNDTARSRKLQTVS